MNYLMTHLIQDSAQAHPDKIVVIDGADCITSSAPGRASERLSAVLVHISES